MKKTPPDLKKVIAAYRMNGSLRKTADVLHLTYWKVRLLLKESSFSTKPQGGFSHRGKPKKKHRSGSFALWLRDHPDTRLPLDLDEIAKITGCSKDAIKCSLYRLRKQGKAIPLLRKKRKKSSVAGSAS